MGIQITATPKLLGLVCLVVLSVILTLGLWPFHTPANEVAWLRAGPGLRFGRRSTVIASERIGVRGSGLNVGGSAEIWLQPRRIWDKGTFLAFYVPGHSRVLFRQSQTDLEIESWRDGAGTAKLYIDGVFRSPTPRFLTIAAGSCGTAVYVDGVRVRASTSFRLATDDFAGRLVVGDSPGDTDSWAGRLFGVAVYHHELPPPQVARHFAAWAHNAFPNPATEDIVALYPMDERAGRIVHDRSGNGLDLFVPEKYEVLDKTALKPFWREFSMSQSYWSAVLKNVIGFVPFGWCFFAWLTAIRIKRPAVVTLILGIVASLTIEILQAYLPTRDSGTSDIITNTLGTWIGIASYRSLRPLISGRISWSPIVVSGLGAQEGD
jgi:hypothetical protein